ncbi:phosphopantetheine-binding [Parafrankia sp. EAN1pec]|uniref:acyl carrier protein n=1 Tax=Parafrankia sp. (strain EAN1pec) TaxID=298653 RepID=UPI0000545114|nr:phosphopantetheine-binding [Frankia sp. EAN1pec]
MNPTSHLNGLSELPAPERHDEVEHLVVAYFKEALMMTASDELELDTSFFDLGLTSLRLGELRKKLEARTGVDIDATVLFNQPTVGQVVDYLDGKLSDS